MGENRHKRPGYTVASVACFVMAGLSFAGVVLADDLPGRIVFGIVWAVLGVVWLGAYFGAFFGRAT